MDTAQLLISVPERLTPDNSPFKAFSRNKKNFPQSWLLGEDYSKEYGLYFPTVKYLERSVYGGITHDLRIEFSVPKLIFNGDNLREVSNSDCGKTIDILYKRLHQMGFDWISHADIANASVVRLDICKNIVFEKKSDVLSIFRILKLGNIGGAYKPINKPYSNGGQSFGFGIKHETVTVYDKGAEMRRSGQAAKFSDISVVRFEAKFGSPATIKKYLKQIGLKVDNPPRFVDVFREDIWKALANNRFDAWYKTIPKMDIDAGLAQVYMNVARNEVGKRGGYSRTCEVITWYAMATLSGLNGAEIDELMESLWGRGYKYRIRKIRDTPMQESQLKLLLKMKEALAEFRLLDETDVKRLKGG